MRRPRLSAMSVRRRGTVLRVCLLSAAVGGPIALVVGALALLGLFSPPRWLLATLNLAPFVAAIPATYLPGRRPKSDASLWSGAPLASRVLAGAAAAFVIAIAFTEQVPRGDAKMLLASGGVALFVLPFVLALRDPAV